MLYNGEGTNRDDDQAIYWLIKSSDLKYPPAQRTLGYHYYYGECVEQNYKRSVENYNNAAIQGDTSSKWNLGLCYAFGEGVSASKEMARYWISEAASDNYQPAIDYLREEKDFFSD